MYFGKFYRDGKVPEDYWNEALRAYEYLKSFDTFDWKKDEEPEYIRML